MFSLKKAKTIFAGSPEAKKHGIFAAGKNFLAEVLGKSLAGAFGVPAKILFLLFFSASGCFSKENLDHLLVLKSIGDSQKEIASCISHEGRLFEKLVAAVKNGKLKPGLSQEEFIRRYGEPILEKKSSRDSTKTILLYRYPIRFFDSDKVYVHFNEAGELISWEYLPY